MESVQTGLAAVSYTHLDVYKRQPRRRVAIQAPSAEPFPNPDASLQSESFLADNTHNAVAIGQDTPRPNWITRNAANTHPWAYRVLTNCLESVSSLEPLVVRIEYSMNTDRLQHLSLIHI